ncbi:hypothetical protein [Actinomycetospora termitidis]|uniref:Uncharacterized protein n=1 Tax=Actinomycetospora termitidis TaxID=3053470 RepID=A0ABT7MGP3_9PSEU|nr:hypothetical protein [Actinomycetospora sp. Odt1-22]MDL5159611.1 hypothetical protein [Actinomycetospora sp. Odt1-22]
MARTPNPRLRAALARQAERTRRAAEALREGDELDADGRRRIIELLAVCGRPEIYEALNVHVQDRVGSLTDSVLRARSPLEDHVRRSAVERRTTERSPHVGRDSP